MRKAKLTALALAVVFLVGLVPFSASANSEFIWDDASIGTLGKSEDILSKYVEIQAFEKYLRGELSICNGMVDVSSYNIPFDSDFLDGAASLIYYEMPDMFHVDGIRLWGSGGLATDIEITYSCTASEYVAMYAEYSEVLDEMVSGIKGNDSLSENEKALLLHDRLALHNEYDYTYTKYDAYDAFVKGSSVCQGYTMAYMALLDEVGIENEYCASEALNHAWNIVYIGGVPYHVDVTWDDPSWASGERGVLGYVTHENFLRSTAGIKETGHSATDFISTPTDTNYDRWSLQDSQSAFILLDDDIYYIDTENSYLMSRNEGEIEYISYGKWKADKNSYYVGNFSRITTDGKDIYFSGPSAVYKYDVSSRNVSEIFSPTLSGYNSIYGLEYIDGYLVCDTNTAPPFSGGTELAQVSYLLPAEEEKEERIMIRSDSYVFSDSGYAFGVRDNETVGAVLGYLDNKDAVICDAEGYEMSTFQLVGTGCTITLAYDGETVDSLSIVVLGDVDGDGTISSTDYLRMKHSFMGMLELSGEYFYAADVTGNGEIDTTDYLRIKNVFLGKYNLYA